MINKRGLLISASFLFVAVIAGCQAKRAGLHPVIESMKPMPKAWQADIRPHAGLLTVIQRSGNIEIGWINPRAGKYKRQKNIKKFASLLSNPVRLPGDGQKLSPNGRFIVFTRDLISMRLFDLGLGKSMKSLTLKKNWQIKGLAWSQVEGDRIGILVSSRNRARVILVNPYTGQIGPTIIDIARPYYLSGAGDVATPPFDIFEMGKTWVAVSFGGTVYVSGLKNHKQSAIKLFEDTASLDLLPQMPPAISPDGKRMLFEKADAFWLREIKAGAKAKKVMDIRPRVNLSRDLYIIRWLTNNRLIVDFTPRDRQPKAPVQVSTYKVVEGKLVLQTRARNQVFNYAVSDGLYNNNTLTSSDGQGMIVGADPVDAPPKWNVILIYSHKQRGFYKVDLGDLLGYEIIGWTKNWDD